MLILNELKEEMIEPLVIGGCILGGGGGGAMAEGRKMAKLAFETGTPSLISLSDLDDDDIVVTVSGVGAPAAKEKFVKPSDYILALELLTNVTGVRPKALITNENGGSASTNGLFQSAITGLPILDLACNGRAHPTGVMGSMTLTEQINYESVQVGVGGKKGTDRRVEAAVRGTINSASKLIRQAAVQAGGFVTVARNPVSVSYLKENGAIHAISHAIEIGVAHENGKTPIEKIENVVKVLGSNSEILGEGKVSNYELKTLDGFDLGRFTLDSGEKNYDLTFWNEYMTVDHNGDRLSTFPDLIMSFSSETGMPVTSAELKEEMNIVVIKAPYSTLRLGSGMFMKKNYEIVEKVLGESVIPFHSTLFEKGTK